MAIRFYQPGDEAQIQELYTKVFKKDRSKKHWEWKFLDNPAEMNPFILVFEEDGNILGHISLWVADAYVMGEEAKISLRVDTMVDPDARGKGIYRQLNEHMLSEAKKAGISYLYGFPAPKAKDLLIKYTTAIEVDNISRYMTILNPINIGIGMLGGVLSPLKPVGRLYQKWRLRRAMDVELPDGWKLEEAAEADARFDELSKATRTLKPVMLKRDAAYLNWRYKQHPDKDYTILALSKREDLKGFIVVKKEKTPLKKGEVTIGYIVDWLGIEEENIWELLMHGALRHLQDTDMIQSWFFPETIAANVMEQNGFREKDRPMPLVIHPLKETSLDKKRDWWITQGDVDSF